MKFSFKALPMVTIIAGKPASSKMCKIISMSESIGTQSIAEFDSTSRDTMKAGEPKWANYVKGCIANFPRNYFRCIFF